MRIAELEAHHDAHVEAEQTINTMVDNAEFPAVFAVCLRSLPHIVPAIQFRKKRGISPATPALAALTTICTYAPPLFEHAAIDSLFDFVKSTRVLSQHENGYLLAVEAARGRERLAQGLWDYLEKQPVALEREIHLHVGATQEDLAEIIKIWERLGVIDRLREAQNHRLRFSTRLDSEVEGCCHECGVRGRGRKELFFKRTKCGKCGAESYYHIKYEHL